MASLTKNINRINQLISENIDDLIFICNENIKCEYFNIKELDFEKKLVDFLHPDDSRLGIKFVEKVFKVGYGKDVFRINGYNNLFKWYEIKGKRFVDNDNINKVFLVCRDITRLKNMENEIKRSQIRYTQLADTLPEIKFWKLLQSKNNITAVQKTREMLEVVINNIPQLIYWKDTNLIYLGCNTNFATINGLVNPHSIIGKTDDNLKWVRDKLDYIKDCERNVMKNNKLEYNVTELLITPSGKQNWYGINRIPLHDMEGNVVGILVTYEDISNRMYSEQKLKESEEKYRGILENIKESYFEVDLFGTFTFINEAFSDLIGFSRDELLGVNYQSLLDEANRKKNRDAYREVFETEQSKSDFQFQFQKSSGEHVTCESSVYLRYDSDGKKIGFSGLARNISEKYSSERKYRHLFESSPYSIILVNKKGIIVDVNPVTEKIFGLSAENLINKNFIDVYIKPEKLLPLFKERYAAVLDGKVAEPMEVQILRSSDNRAIWIHIDDSLVKIGRETVFQVIIQDVTAQKIAEKDLRNSQEELKILNKGLEKKVQERTKDLIDSERQYRTTINSLGDPLHVVNKDLKIILVNQAFKNWLDELNLDTEIFGRKISEAFPFLDSKIFDEYKQIFDTGMPLITMENILLPELEVITETRKIPIFHEGKVEQIITIIRDITESNKAEQKLKEEREKVQNYLDIAGVILLVLNADQTVQLINRKGCEILEEDESEIIGINFIDKYIPEINRELVKKNYNRFINGEIEFLENTEAPIITKNGEIRIIAWYNRVIKNSEGMVIGSLSSGQDITENKRAEQKLKESELNFRNMVNNLDVAFYRGIYKGALLMHNQACNIILGLELDESIVGTDSSQFFVSEEINRRYYNELEEKGFVRNFIAQVKKLNGNMITIDLNSHVIYNSEGEIAEVEGTFTDITEKFKLQQDLLESEKKLREQNVELMKLDEIKNDFITMAAHELKTPLISISGYTDYILMKHRNRLSPEIIDDLKTVQRNVTRLEVLMDQLLDVMKIDENKLKLQKEQVNITKIINDCLDELSYLINEKNLEIILNISHEIMLNVDPTRIFTVFTNLISNAIKFTPDYGWIEISCKLEEDKYIFEVKDNGIGLAKDELLRLFIKFERIRQPILNENLNIKDSGTGLGLYITKGIVIAHNGEIRASSEGFNKGTTFEFTLPS